MLLTAWSPNSGIRYFSKLPRIILQYDSFQRTAFSSNHCQQKLLNSSSGFPGNSSFCGINFFKFLLFGRSEEHTSELQSRPHLVCRLLLEKKNNQDKPSPCSTAVTCGELPCKLRRIMMSTVRC